MIVHNKSCVHQAAPTRGLQAQALPRALQTAPRCSSAPLTFWRVFSDNLRPPLVAAAKKGKASRKSVEFRPRHRAMQPTTSPAKCGEGFGDGRSVKVLNSMHPHAAPSAPQTPPSLLRMHASYAPEPPSPVQQTAFTRQNTVGYERLGPGPHMSIKLTCRRLGNGREGAVGAAGREGAVDAAVREGAVDAAVREGAVDAAHRTSARAVQALPITPGPTTHREAGHPGRAAHLDDSHLCNLGHPKGAEVGKVGGGLQLARELIELTSSAGVGLKMVAGCWTQAPSAVHPCNLAGAPPPASHPPWRPAPQPAQP